MDSIPNIHYIGVIESDGERVVYKKYPIDLPCALLDSLKEMEGDVGKTILDMQTEVERFYPLDARKWFISSHLAPLCYDATFVVCVYFPTFVTVQAFEAQKITQIQEAAARYDKDTEERRMNGWAPLSKTRDASIAESVATWAWRNKVEFRQVMRRYIYSHSYRATRKKAGLKKRLNADVKMFSTDTIGWTTYYYKISRDVSIRFDSNFGFGRRSYFQLGLIYRGIEIFPFSDYVRYYFANWRTLIAHTRSYELKRRSWDYALEFVVEHANAAATDPVRFVREFILGEVKKMIDGLYGIVRMTSEQFHEEMNPLHETRTKYLGVSAPDRNSIVCYKAYPGEMLIAYKAEKIGGALTFLGKLKQLGEIHVEVKQASQEIVKMVEGIVPELTQNMEGIAADIKHCEEGLASLQAEMKPLQDRIAFMDSEIANLQAATLATQSLLWMLVPDNIRFTIQSNVRNCYLQLHPEYCQMSANLSQCQVRCEGIKVDITNRRKFYNRLSNCKNVAQGAKGYERLVDALRPHEKEIERLFSVELGDRRIEEVEPEELKKMRNNIVGKYHAEHPDYADLVARRDAVERMMDAFDVMRVR